MILEIENKNIKITPVRVKNDDPIDVPKPLPNWNFFSLFVGTPGSGKTTLAINMLMKYYKRKYNKIYFFSASQTTLPEKFVKKLSPDRTFTDMSNIEATLEEIKGLENEKVLIVFDDMVKGILDNEKTIINLAFNRRHYSAGCSIIMITQKLNKIPLSIRTAVDSIFFWSLSNKRELESLQKDYIQSLDKDEFNELLHYIIKSPEKHKFLFIDLKNNKFYLKFNRLKFSDSEAHSSQSGST